jgi:hypothetical protein
MTEWIESAEEKQRIREAIIQKEQGRGIEVFEQNVQALNGLFEQIKILISRVEQIALEYRKPCLEIGFTHLEGTDSFEFYGSANTIRKKKVLFINLSEDNYVCWRRVTFIVTDQYDKVKITISEKCTHEKNKTKSYGIREKYKFSISELKTELSESIITWLVYKMSNSELKSYLPISSNRKSKSINIYM